MINILVLCTGNSARSILGEAIINQLGAPQIHAFSAGSNPKGEPHPAALRLLAAKGIDTSTFRSKSWTEFANPGSPPINIALTVCGNAAGETCPFFTGAPVRAHWGLPDPADAKGGGAEVDAAFSETWRLLEMRVKAMISLPLDQMEQGDIRMKLNDIGRMEGAV